MGAEGVGPGTLEARIEALVKAGADAPRDESIAVVEELLVELESGRLRAAEPTPEGWRVNAWVKAGLLLGFRAAEVRELEPAGPMGFRDKAVFPPRALADMPGVRVVPGGTAIRRGAFVGERVVLMPPAYVNCGAYVGEGSMIDSHALVGSCAQLGAGIHLSAGAQVGGVLEPPGAMPVIIEDGVFVGGLSAILEGVRVEREAVIGAGVVLTASTPVFDLRSDKRVTRDDEGVLVIPERAVVIAGTRPLDKRWAREQGLAASAALIVKERDAGTDARAALEGALR